MLKTPKAKRRVILTCLPPLVGTLSGRRLVAGESRRRHHLGKQAGPVKAVAGKQVTGQAGPLASGAADPSYSALLERWWPVPPRSSQVEQPALVAAAAGADNRQFYRLGELLVQDGLSDTIINLSREMNGWWYAWSVRHAPPSGARCFYSCLAAGRYDRRSVPGEYFKFLWTIYPGAAATVTRCWPGSVRLQSISSTGTAARMVCTATASGASTGLVTGSRSRPPAPGDFGLWTACSPSLRAKPGHHSRAGPDFHTGGRDDKRIFLHA